MDLTIHMHVHNLCIFKLEVNQFIRNKFMMLNEINTGRNSVAELLMDTSLHVVIKQCMGL